MALTTINQKELKLNRTIIYVVYATLIITSIIGWILTNKAIQTDTSRRLKNETKIITTKVKSEFDRLGDALLDMRAHFQDNDEISDESFQNYARQAKLIKRFPGIQGFAYTKVYHSTEAKNNIISSKKREGVKDYKLWPLTDKKLKTAITTIKPDNWRNRSYLGFDMNSENKRKQTILDSIESNAPKISPVLELVLEDENTPSQAGFLIFLTHYKTPQLSGLINSKNENIKGLFIAILRADDFFTKSFSNSDYLDEKINYSLYPVRNSKKSEKPKAIYKRFDISQGSNSLFYFDKIEIFGSKWKIKATPLPHFLTFFEKYAAEGVLLGLLLLSFVIILLVTYSQKYLASEAEFSIKAQQLAEKADAANKAKTSFLANMSHEIRTPLGAIMGYSELLIDESISNERKSEMVKNIQKNGESLSKLLNDILDSAKIEAGKISIENKPTSIASLIHQIESDQNLKAFDKNIYLKFKQEGPLPDYIMIDDVRLKQIITNLINNALRFTEKGGVTVITRTENKKGKPYIFIDVQDTGIGIHKNKRDFLFKPFEQADTSSTRKFGGTGLGLNLSRNLARSMGGDIKLISSKLGRGSLFRVEIPITLAPEHFVVKSDSKVSDASTNLDLKGSHILLVEDSKENQNIFKLFLEQANAKVTICDNGEDAINEGLNKIYHLILMDIQIPKKDGKEVTKFLREKGIVKPIIAITAHAQKEEVSSCLKAGCNSHLAKPFTKEQLLNKISPYF